MMSLHRHRHWFAPVLGALAATGFAPLGLWPLSLICVAMLLWLAEQTHTRKDAFLLGWLFGVGHFTLGNNWIAHAFVYQDAMPHWFGYGAVVALSLYLAIYPALATLGLHLVRARWPQAAATPLFAALWILTEYGRATILTGFAWDPLGMAWLGTGVDRAARWIGVYGLSGLTVIAAGALLALFRRRWHIGGPILAAFLAMAILGHVDLSKTVEAPVIPVTVVQPNIDQSEKYDPALEIANFLKLEKLSGRSSADNPRLVFWPEAAIEAFLDMEPEWLARVASSLGRNDLLMTGGSKVYFKDHKKGFYTDRTLIGANNSAWVVTPDARLIARYDKAHLVPYGEYLPMRSLLEPLGLSRLVPGDADFWPGPGPRSLLLPTAKGRPALKMGVQICYEIIFSGQVVHRQNRPAFLYNPSNDAWFGDWGPPQHLAQARMRAIEEAMPIIRSTPTGISAVIDGHGRLLDSIPLHKAGAIETTLPPALPPTLFARFGNLLPMAFAAFLIALTALLLARRPTSR